MNNSSNQGGTCKAVCWAIGLVAGAYLGYILVIDFGQDILQSAVLGIVALLLVGLLLRWLFCNRNSNKLQQRMNEANARAVERDRPNAPDIAAESHAIDTAAAVTEAMEDDSMDEIESRFDDPEPETLTATMDALSLNDAVEAVAEDSVSILPENYEPELQEPEPEFEPEPELEPEPEPEPQIEFVAPVEAVTPEPAAAEPAEKQEAVPEQPAGQDAPNDGGADDLRQIKGIGPESQKALNAIGIFNFVQIARMNRNNIAWLNQNMPGAEGGATRDRWKRQSKKLANGEDTKFSARVKAGEIYKN